MLRVWCLESISLLLPISSSLSLGSFFLATTWGRFPFLVFISKPQVRISPFWFSPVPELFYVYFLSRSSLHTPCIGMYPLPTEDPPPAVSFYALLRISDLLVWVDRLTLDSVLLLRGWCRFASPPPNNTVIIRGKRTCIFRGCPNCERETGHSVMMIMDWWFFYFLTIHFAHSHPPKCHCSLALASWRSSEFSLPSQEFLPQGSWSNPLETPFKFLQPTASLPYVAILLPQGTSSFMRITILCSWMHTKLHCPKSKWLATQVPICHVSLSSLALLIFPPPPMNLWRAAIHAYATTLSALLMHSIWRQKIIICADSVISSGRGFLHFDLVLVLSFCG